MQTEYAVSGCALIGEELEKRSVTIIILDGKITAIEEEKNREECWICPAFFNAHVHLGDTIAMDCTASGDLTDLVKPPGGLKHRILAAATAEELSSGMRASIRDMTCGGIAGFADFREGGIDGVRALQTAAAGIDCMPVIFGRDGGEYIADGIGISSARDVPDLEEKCTRARNMGKMVAFHAGECNPDDIDAALSFDPDLLIHCTHATDRQLAAIAEKNIPVAVCPQSNWRLRVAGTRHHPPIRKMLDLGITVLLGTDNVMFVQPDLLREMAFAYTLYDLKPEEALFAAVAGSKFLGNPFFIEEGMNANFFMINTGQSNIRFSRNMYKTIVHRVCARHIVKKVIYL
jgi:cytosine/adenosine deaminase-related metal-dependent hydrolase